MINLLYGWSTTTVSDFSNFKSDGIDSNFKLNIINYWRENKISGNAPSGRISCAFSYDNKSSSAVLLGGYNDGNILPDMWVYDPINNKWYQESNVPPQPRYGHKIVNIGNGRFFLFGGIGENGYLNDTWIYDFKTGWEKKNNYIITPSSRAYFDLCYNIDDNKIYLFGGKNENIYYNDLWMYDIINDSWSFVNIITSSPCARCGHGMTYITENKKIIVFGGETQQGYYLNDLNDLWVFDTINRNWQCLQQNIDLPNKPSKRAYFGFSYIQSIKRTILFGGYPLNNETWLYDFNSNQWVQGKTDNGPEMRSYLCMTVIDDSIPYIFGGFGETYYNDTWKYLVRSSGSIETTPLIPKTSNVSWKYLVPNINPLPSSSSIYFQIARTNDIQNWDNVFRGYDATPNTYFQIKDTNKIDISNVCNNYKYIKIKFYFYTDTPPLGPELNYFSVSYNCLPNQPILLTPANNSRTNIIKPTFIWNQPDDLDDEKDPVFYHIMIDSNSNFSRPLVDKIVLISSYTSEISLYEGKWYWKVYTSEITEISTRTYSETFMLVIDTHPPGVIKSITALPHYTQNRSIELRWTSPGDDGTVGPLYNYRYIVCYSTVEPILTEIQWNNIPSENKRINTVFLTYPGDEERGFIDNLPYDGTTFYFAMKIQDQAGNISPISLISVSACTNSKPIVNIQQPDGTYPLSGKANIQWTYYDPDPNDTISSISIILSSDTGNNYNIVIASGLPVTTSYYWNTKEVKNGSVYKIKVLVKDRRGLIGENVSSTFTVININEKPIVNISTDCPINNGIVSGIIDVNLIVYDPNLTDTHYFNVWFSTNNGNSYTELISTTSIPFFKLDTTKYINGTNYKLKIIVTDSGSEEYSPLSSEIIYDFSISNNNLPPNKFNLIYPLDNTQVSPLRVKLIWENKGDPNLEDIVNYTLIYSLTENFDVSVSTIINNLTGTSYILSKKDNLNRNTTYYWKVVANDELGLKQNCDKIFKFITTDEYRAISSDGLVSVHVLSNLPTDGYIFVDEIINEYYDLIKQSELNIVDDRLIKLLNSKIYNVRIYNILDEQPISVENIKMEISFIYNDNNDDGYYDKVDVPIDNLKILYLDEKLKQCKLPEDKQSIDKSSRKINCISNKIGLFTLSATNIPKKLISNIKIFPNPFVAGKQNTKIRYVLTKDSSVKIEIYTLTGTNVRKWYYQPGIELKSKGQPEGYTNEQDWDGQNDTGEIVANGMYLIIIEAKNETEFQREMKYVAVIK